MKIIYEDENILAVDKPAGLLVHQTEKSGEETLVDWLLENRPEVKGVGDAPELRPGIVHRLDKDTSGIEAFEFLKKQFQNREVKKKYIALVHKNIKNDEGVINLPIGKSKKDFRRRTAERDLRGETREAITEYKVLERFAAENDRYTLLEVFPKTGRTHQIRVHLKALGNAVVCDGLYGPKKQVCPFGLKRQFLHANAIEFTAPDGSEKAFEADLSEDLVKALESLRSLQNQG
jgi:23S rRNA pseudouridine1911/1915/1917 synthase